MNVIFPPWDFWNTVRSIEFWIKVWGMGLVLAGFSLSLIQAPWNSIVLAIGYGLVLIFGKRTQAIRMLGLFFSAFLAFGAFIFVYYHGGIKPDVFRWYYFFFFFVFSVSLFTFLLMPDVKQAFGPSPFPQKPLPTLALTEERRIKFWVRVVAMGMVLEGLISSTFSDWFRSHGVPPEGELGMTLAVIAGLGLLFFRQNIGRRFGLFVCLTMWIGMTIVISQSRVAGLFGYSYSFFVILISLITFFFLLHPKTKAVFK